MDAREPLASIHRAEHGGQWRASRLLAVDLLACGLWQGYGTWS